MKVRSTTPHSEGVCNALETRQSRGGRPVRESRMPVNMGNQPHRDNGEAEVGIIHRPLLYPLPGLGIAPDALNTIISVGRGDFVSAGLNFIAMLPVIGQGTKGAQLAGKAVKAIDKGTDFAKPVVTKVVAPAKRASGKTVLGRFPDYVNLSDELGARRFDIPEKVWNGLSDAEKWAANNKFLDRTIARGDKIILASPIDRATPGSYFRKELDYLFSNGYKLGPDGQTLLPPSS